MKEYVSYDLMKEIGVDAPYFGYADIKVNGNNWGLYLAVELYNDSYEQRVSGDTSGTLYNVKSMDMGGGDNAPKGNMPSSASGWRLDMGSFSGRTNQNNEQQTSANSQKRNIDGRPDENLLPAVSTSSSNQDGRQNTSQSPQTTNSEQRDDFSAANEGTEQPDSIPSSTPDQNRNGGNRPNGGMGGRGSSGGSLEYSDDNSSSYSAIFNNAVGKASENDYQKVIAALKVLSEGKDLEKYFDVDGILRYLAAHTIVVNLDSYSSSIAKGGQPKLPALHPSLLVGSQSFLMNTQLKPHGGFFVRQRPRRLKA